MIKIVGVRFRDKGKTYHFDPADLDLKIGDAVVVETERGAGYAMVSSIPRFIQQFPSGRKLKKVLKRRLKKTSRLCRIIKREKQRRSGTAMRRLRIGSFQ